MKKLCFIAFLLLISGCAAVNTFTSEVSKSGLRIDRKKFDYINWYVPHSEDVRIINGIYDGDTVVADDPGATDEAGDSSGEVIRLLGIDTPELAHPDQGFTTNEPGAVEATNFTKKAVNWKKVILVTDPENLKGVFGRTLALIFYKDKKGRVRCLNWELLKRGLARENLWSRDMLCAKSKWRQVAKIAKLKSPRAYRALARRSLLEKFVDDALDYYRQGVKKYPSNPQLRKDLAVLYGKLASYESNRAKRNSYVSDAVYHWQKLRGTKYDSLARQNLKNYGSAQ